MTSTATTACVPWTGDHVADAEEISAGAGLDAPVQLVTVNKLDNGRVEFGINRKAQQWLSEIQAEVVVVGIAGQYRTGKSYLMNRIQGVSKGFHLGNSTVGCTRGIWLWGKPQPMQDGTKRALICLDTEGLGDVDRDSEDFDTKLLVLTTLLCSTMVFNTLVSLTENTLNELSAVAQMASKIHVQREANGNDQQQVFDHKQLVAKMMPQLVIALRDFSLDLPEATPDRTGEQIYLEKALNQNNKKNADANAVRQTLKDLFLYRILRVFPRPGKFDEEEMRQLEAMSDDQLSPTFRTAVESFTSWIRDGALSKMIPDPAQQRGTVCNGRRFALYLEQIVNALNDPNSDVVNIPSALRALSQAECIRGYDCALLTWNNLVEDLQLPMPAESLSARIREFFSEAQRVYGIQATGVLFAEYQERLRQHIGLSNEGGGSSVAGDSLAAQLRVRNQLLSEEKCAAVAKKLLTDLTKGEFTSIDKFEAAVMALEKTFRKEAAGPACDRVWSDLSSGALMSERRRVLDHLALSEEIKKAVIANGVAASALAAAAAQAEEMRQAILKKDDEQAALNMQLQQQAEAHKQELKAYASKQEADLKALEAQFARANADQKKILEEEVAKLRAEIVRAQEQAAKLAAAPAPGGQEYTGKNGKQKVYIGPNGGKYIINGNGHKTYLSSLKH